MKYKNPRNLCSGSVRQLNNKITAERGVRFYAFSLVEAEGVSFDNSHEKEFIFLRSLGFETVEYRKVTADTLSAGIDVFEEKIQHYDIPSDGLVLLMDDIAYGESLGTTAKFPRNAMAFKWADEQQETTLTDVEWSASRTGLINPVAIFEPVELEGTTVKRASVHNVSIVRSLKLGIGDRIRVYKANMIIPQISENLTMSDSLEIPSVCPVCGGQTQIRREVDTEVLICTNPDCTAKKIKSFAHFVSRNAMNIEGLSEMTLEKFIGRGFIHNFADIYHLEDFRSQIEEMEGFGRRSYENLAASIMRSRKTTLSRVLYAVGIVGIGTANARLICDHYQNDLQAVLEASADDLGQIEGIGPVLAASVSDFLKDEKNREKLNALLSELEIEAPQGNDRPQVLSGKTFVITGKVYKFENRDALKDYILKLGGKAAGSVSSNTDYLINNDVTSTSGKNKKAKQLGVPIISEDEFLAMAEAEGAE